MRYLASLVFYLLFIPSFADAKNYVIIGDSITCGSFGPRLIEQLSGSGNNVKVYCTESSTPSSWLDGTNPTVTVCTKKRRNCRTIRKTCKTANTQDRTLTPCQPNGNVPRIDSILKNNKNAEFIVALGANAVDHTAHQSFRDLAGKIAGEGNRCRWIGPPNMRTKTKALMNEFYTDLEQKMMERADQAETENRPRKKYCEFTDSRPHSQFNKGYELQPDGIHPTAAGGIYFADKIEPFISGRQKLSERPDSISPTAPNSGPSERSL